MICPDNDRDCDNVGCRRGGCQGRRPKPPLFRARPAVAANALPLLPPEIAGGAAALRAGEPAASGARQPVMA